MSKLELFSANEQGLSNRRKLKVEFDSLMKEIREVRDSTRSVREKIMRRIVDASEMDSALRREMPDEMARLKDLELRKSSLESRLKVDRHDDACAFHHGGSIYIVNASNFQRRHTGEQEISRDVESNLSFQEIHTTT